MLWQSPLKRVNIARNWSVIFILMAPKNYVIFLEIEMMKSFRIWPDIVQCAELKTCVQKKSAVVLKIRVEEKNTKIVCPDEDFSFFPSEWRFRPYFLSGQRIVVGFSIHVFSRKTCMFSRESWKLNKTQLGALRLKN